MELGRGIVTYEVDEGGLCIVVHVEDPSSVSLSGVETASREES